MYKLFFWYEGILVNIMVSEGNFLDFIGESKMNRNNFPIGCEKFIAGRHPVAGLFAVYA